MKTLLITFGIFLLLGAIYGLTRKPASKYKPESREGNVGKWRDLDEGKDPTDE